MTWAALPSILASKRDSRRRYHRFHQGFRSVETRRKSVEYTLWRSITAGDPPPKVIVNERIQMVEVEDIRGLDGDLARQFGTYAASIMTAIKDVGLPSRRGRHGPGGLPPWDSRGDPRRADGDSHLTEGLDAGLRAGRGGRNQPDPESPGEDPEQVERPEMPPRVERPG